MFIDKYLHCQLMHTLYTSFKSNILKTFSKVLQNEIIFVCLSTYFLSEIMKRRLRFRTLLSPLTFKHCKQKKKRLTTWDLNRNYARWYFFYWYACYIIQTNSMAKVILEGPDRTYFTYSKEITENRPCNNPSLLSKQNYPSDHPLLGNFYLNQRIRVW